jgi:transcriptional regulator with XRE-family HTH domain/tetratricopeptide (TPR) repeat protein
MQIRESTGRTFVSPDGTKIIELRARKGWTQEKLAEKSILSVRTVQNIERSKPTQFGTVVKLAIALGVEAKDCIRLEGSRSAIADALAHKTNAECPYRGLLPFREEDKELLFGRETLVDLLQGKLDHKNIIQVSGPSGSGKSSLIAAGLIPAVRRLQNWRVLFCRPGLDPFASLAGTLIPHLEPAMDEIARAGRIPELRGLIESGQLSYLLDRLLPEPGHCALLFIDQFEELFTHCASQDTRYRYLNCLLEFARAPRDSGRTGATVVYTIRSDFASRLLAHREFIDAIQDADVKIGPMTRPELESAIREPALRRGVRFEHGLVERILHDIGREPGALPLLEFALTELWAKEVDRLLTHAAYEDVGQLSGAIAKRAETIFRSLAPSEQDAARRILTHLVRIGEDGGEDAKLRAPLSALRGQDQLNSDAGRRVLDVLVASRLITVGVGEDARAGETAEIAHEALIRQWPRFTQWLHEDRELLVWRQRMRVLANQWREAARETGLLLRGPLLDEARLWMSRRRDSLSGIERDFISASVALNNRERANRPIGTLELLFENSGDSADGSAAGSPSGEERISRLLDEAVLHGQRGLWRLQINVMPVPPAQEKELRRRLPHTGAADLAPLVPPNSRQDDIHSGPLEDIEGIESPQPIDSETLSLVRQLQIRGASGLALELLTPQLDGIHDPALRLKFASIVFDMMHVRGRYGDAAALIQQELALYPEAQHLRSDLLLPLRVRLIHHQMFYRPVTDLWPSMLDLLSQCEARENPDTYGEILFMLGGNLGALRGDYVEARSYLVRAIRSARERQDDYLLARCLRKYADFLRNRGHLTRAEAALREAVRLSESGKGTRQRVYALGCLGDLERQKGNYTASREYFERAINLAREMYIPGWMGNLHVGLAELALEEKSVDEARAFVDQAEASYRATGPRHWWGDIQVGLCRCRLMRLAGDSGWADLARTIRHEAEAAGYRRDGAFAARLMEGDVHRKNVLMFL